MKKALTICILLSCFNSSIAQNADIDLLREINLNRNTAFDRPLQFISDSDSPITLGVPAGILLVAAIKRDTTIAKKGFAVGGSLLITGVVTAGMKYGFKRDRPFVTYPEIEKLSNGGSPSFPSGHTSSAFSMATSLTIAWPKWYVAAPSFLYASAVGYSRMHLGVHYPSDVAVGALIGAGSSWLSHYLTKRFLWNKD
jgi:membrane-associated phospholipid phosphatase